MEGAYDVFVVLTRKQKVVGFRSSMLRCVDGNGHDAPYPQQRVVPQLNTTQQDTSHLHPPEFSSTHPSMSYHYQYYVDPTAASSCFPSGAAATATAGTFVSTAAAAAVSSQPRSRLAACLRIPITKDLMMAGGPYTTMSPYKPLTNAALRDVMDMSFPGATAAATCSDGLPPLTTAGSVPSDLAAAGTVVGGGGVWGCENVAAGAAVVVHTPTRDVLPLERRRSSQEDSSKPSRKSTTVATAGTVIVNATPTRPQLSQIEETAVTLSEAFPRKYALLKKLGEGGFGSVWSVRRVHDGAVMALKVVHCARGGAEDELSRRNRFARFEPYFLAACRRSPFVVQCEEHKMLLQRAGTTTHAAASVVTVMEWVQGRDLRTELLHVKERSGAAAIAATLAMGTQQQQQPIVVPSPEHLWSELDVAIVFIQLLAGMQHLHDRGIVHRDLKPGNIFLSSSSSSSLHDPPSIGVPMVKIGDFGLASLRSGVDWSAIDGLQADDQHDLQMCAKMSVGTVYYAAPELCVASDAPPFSPATDMWALGVMLYEMLAGRRPFVGANKSEVLASLRSSTPRTYSAEVQAARGGHCASSPPSTVATGTIIRLIDALLAPRPEDRPTPAQCVAAAPTIFMEARERLVASTRLRFGPDAASHVLSHLQLPAAAVDTDAAPPYRRSA